MFNENQSKIGRYYIYSILFHLILIGLISYLAIRYKPEIQSIGSNVVVSVISRIPRRHIRVRVAKKRFVKAKRVEHIKVEIVRHRKQAIKIIKHIPIKSTPVKKVVKTHISKAATAVSSNVYSQLSRKVRLNNVYNKVRESLIKGNVHKFIAYNNKIVPIIMSNFNIPLSKYLSYKSVVAIQVTDSGRIYGIKLVKSSGNSYFDSQSIEAVKLSSPLPPTPKGFMHYMNSKNAGEGALIKFDPKEIIKNK